MTSPVLAVVLAGGLARRLGGVDKALHPLAGRPLLDHVIARVAPQVRSVAINANGDPARFAAWRLPVIADTVANNPGPLAGILAGMRWAAGAYPDCADIVSVPTDTPYLPTDLVARLLAVRSATGRAIVCAASDGRVHPVVALWPVALAEALEADLRGGFGRVGAWAERFGLAQASFDSAGGDPFRNLNAPSDFPPEPKLP